jgi:hypothetical protein
MIVVDKDSIDEFDIYEEANVIVAGLSFRNAPIQSIVIQQEEPLSSLSDDRMGMYIEVDGKGAYNTKQFTWLPEKHCLYIATGRPNSDTITEYVIEMPSDIDSNQERLLKRMERVRRASFHR